MAYTERFLHYLKFPRVPDEILDKVNWNINEYCHHGDRGDILTTYKWSDDFNKDINKWCQENICDSLYFGFMIITGDLDIHKDPVTKAKFNYVLDPGGSDVRTEFYAEDRATLIQSEHIPPHTWCLLKTDEWHRVTGVEPGRTRFVITSRLYGKPDPESIYT